MIELPALTKNEILAAAHHGLIRRVEGIMDQRRIDKTVLPNQCCWDLAMEPPCSEMALAKYVNVCWTGLGAIGNSDAGQWEARWTRHFDTGQLIAYPKDEADSRLVLLDGFAPYFRIIGWLYAYDAKQPKWWNEKMQSWWVQREFLKGAESVRDTPPVAA